MKIKSILIGIGVALAIFILVPFNSFNLIGTKGSGNIIKETRQVSSFHGIEAGSAFSIIVKKGDVQNLQIETDDNIMPLIKSKVKDGVLELSTKGSINNASSFKVNITVAHLDKVDISGACKLSSPDRFDEQDIEIDASGASKLIFKVKTNHLDIDASGASTVILTGFANNADMEVSGASKLKAYELEINTADIDCSGASHAYINAKESLKGESSGASSITYMGNPKIVDIETSGAGSVGRK